MLRPLFLLFCCVMSLRAGAMPVLPPGCGGGLAERTPEQIRDEFLTGDPFALWVGPTNPTGTAPLWGVSRPWDETERAVWKKRFQEELKMWRRARSVDDRFAMLVIAMLKAEEKEANERFQSRNGPDDRYRATNLYYDVFTKFLHVAAADETLVRKRFSPALWGELGACATRCFRRYLQLTGQKTTEPPFESDATDTNSVFVRPDPQGGDYEKLAAALLSVGKGKFHFAFRAPHYREGGDHIHRSPEGSIVFLSAETLARPQDALGAVVRRYRAYREPDQDRSPFDIAFVGQDGAAVTVAETVVVGQRTLEDHIARLREQGAATYADAPNLLANFPSYVGSHIQRLRLYLREARRAQAELEGVLHRLATQPVLRFARYGSEAEGYWFGVEAFLAGAEWGQLQLKPRGEEQVVIWRGAGGKTMVLPVKANHLEPLCEAFNTAMSNLAPAAQVALRPQRIDLLWRLLWALKRQLEVTIGHFAAMHDQTELLRLAAEKFLTEGPPAYADLEAALAGYRAIAVERNTLRTTETREARGVPLPDTVAATFVEVPTSPTLAAQLQGAASAKGRADVVGQIGVDAMLRLATARGWRVEDRSLDNLGYDLLLTHVPTGAELFVEVKARKAGATTFSLTGPEADFAFRHREKTVLAFVSVDEEGRPRVTVRALNLQSAPDEAAQEVTFDLRRFLETRPERSEFSRNP